MFPWYRGVSYERLAKLSATGSTHGMACVVCGLHVTIASLVLRRFAR